MDIGLIALLWVLGALLTLGLFASELLAYEDVDRENRMIVLWPIYLAGWLVRSVWRAWKDILNA